MIQESRYPPEITKIFLLLFLFRLRNRNFSNFGGIRKSYLSIVHIIREISSESYLYDFIILLSIYDFNIIII